MNLFDYILIEFEKESVKEWYYNHEDDSDEVIQRLVTAAHSLLTIDTMKSDAMSNHLFKRSYDEYFKLYPNEEVTKAQCVLFLRIMYLKS
jgi:hypothetical protein